MQVKLSDIIEGMEMQSEEGSSYLNLEKGEIVYVSNKALAMAEDGEEYEHLVDWQQEEMKLAYDIVDNFDKYVSLPSNFDINEYDMMESFCFNRSDSNIRDLLLNAIRGKGAFRRFREQVERLGIVNEWYDYRDNCYKEIARDFCESNNIDYVE